MSRAILFEGVDFSKVDRDVLIYWMGYLTGHLLKLVDEHRLSTAGVNCQKCYGPFPCPTYVEYQELCQLTSEQGRKERAYEQITSQDL